MFVFFQNMATKYITYTYPLLFPAALLLGRYLAVKGSRVFSRGYLLFHDIYAVLAGAVYWCRFKGIAPVQDEVFSVADSTGRPWAWCMLLKAVIKNI